ncbi:ABC transporter ATP-binding protein [Enterococcus saccharolyticus]|uniref:ABC transporter ATP-binding protein n=1 Tax=Candidatus Enterococcus willemsii TaxID=1857215 RepID=A0ABQ6Z2L3_9ENTE|nr:MULTISPECIES: ABC transporter ATP-binding protein [Enterococcus]KAF1305699.1 ABC transporter ATP-binding protein [Enterococcus sp. CU12B]MCD5001457.1 ABC transporter ATP-binding protein [Enterococcus saccharolyticus]
MTVITIDHLTKDYGNNKGVFDVTLTIKAGEVYGYLGPNGAGKSTTMRHLMGFSKPQTGSVKIFGMDCWTEQKEIQKRIGYLPGEISFPDDMTGLHYLKLIANMRKMTDFSYATELLDYFEINPNAGIKRMSKGMKQKIGIVAAFMHRPELLLLDEPTSGLDPLMQNRFIELMEKEKAEGKTIILSSHIFEEVEKTCDRIGMIRNGHLIKEVTVDELRHSQLKTYKIEFIDSHALTDLKQIYPEATYRTAENQMIVTINDSNINQLLAVLSKHNVRFLKEEKHTLEEYFMQFYGGNQHV